MFLKSKTYKFDFPIDFSVCKSIQCKKFKIILRASDRFEYFEVDNGFSHQKSWYSFLPLYNPKLRYKKSIDYSRLLGYIFNFLLFLFVSIYFLFLIHLSIFGITGQAIRKHHVQEIRQEITRVIRNAHQLIQGGWKLIETTLTNETEHKMTKNM